MIKNLSLFSEVDILINGKPVKKYSHNGKIFIEAKDGTEYSIRLKNNGMQRILAVASVDGINVINGEAAGATETGYVINGFSSYEIKGFRTSNELVNAFKFSKKDESYAAKSESTQGDTSNCGVIGVRLFSEKVQIEFENKRRIWWDTWETPKITPTTIIDNPYQDNHIQVTCISDSPKYNFYNCSSPRIVPQTLRSLSVNNVQEFDLGTQFSDKEISDKVSDVEFLTGNLETEHEIFYASRGVLASMGISLEKETKVFFPSAFPSKFCKPPKK